MAAAVSMRAGTFLDVESTNDQAAPRLAEEKARFDGNRSREEQAIQRRLVSAGFSDSDAPTVMGIVGKHPEAGVKIAAGPDRRHRRSGGAGRHRGRQTHRLTEFSRRCSSAVGAHGAGKLGTGCHTGLPELLPQVVVDGGRAEEQLRGDVPVALALADQPGDLRLLGGELLGGPGRPLAGAFAGGQVTNDSSSRSSW